MSSFEEGRREMDPEEFQLLRDLVYSAWVNSGRGEPDFDPNDQTNNPQNPLYNPATGAAIKIPAKKVVKFRVAKAVKDAIVPPKKTK